MRYILEKYRGPRTRYTCPSCGRNGEFTRYIDTQTGRYIAEDVGICNRTHKCGYHKRPSDVLQQNRTLVPISKKVYIKPPTISNIEICTIDASFMHESLSRPNCAYLRWIESIIGSSSCRKLKILYHIGSTEDDRAIFWQIDSKGRIRTGKIMRYDEQTGRRVKEGSGNCSWVHTEFRKELQLPDNWQLTQCLYGEDLIKFASDKPIAIVESYKSAHIGAAFLGDYLWTSVDNINGLSVSRLSALKGKNVILFPDTGKGHELWSAKIGSIASEVGFNWSISDWLIKNTTVEQQQQGLDIADIILNSLDYDEY